MLDINIAHGLGLQMHQPPGNLALLIPEAEATDQARPASAATKPTSAKAAAPASKSAADAMQRSPAGRRKAEKRGSKTGPGSRR